jgi:hypothetical protein
MGLAEYQAALARAYTDADFRALLQTHPAEAQRISGLSDDDIARLLAIAPAQLDFFAASLVSKRRGEVAKLLPLTVRALGPRFRDVFGEFSSTTLPSGIRKHLLDATAFAEYVVTNVVEPPYAVDIARYEAAWIAIRNRSAGIIVRLLRYSPADLINGKRPAKRRIVAVWLKSRLTGLRYWTVRLGWSGREEIDDADDRTRDGVTDLA